jgi:hypothetical protein
MSFALPPNPSIGMLPATWEPPPLEPLSQDEVRLRAQPLGARRLAGRRGPAALPPAPQPSV